MKEKTLQIPVTNFGQLFKFFRLQAGFITIGQFADALADHNIIYCESLYYHWQRNNKIPTNRQLLLQIIKVFIDHGSITNSTQANIFLESSNKGYLTNSEIIDLSYIDTNPAQEEKDNFYKALNQFIELEKINKSKPKNKVNKIPKSVRFNLMIEGGTNNYLSKIAKQKNTTKSSFIRQLIFEYKQRENDFKKII